jgi:uncharacterized membrane protein YcaP (DUF421 family)
MKQLTGKDNLFIILIGALLMFPIFASTDNPWLTLPFVVLLSLFYRVVGWVEGANRRFFWEPKDKSTDSEYRF